MNKSILVLVICVSLICLAIIGGGMYLREQARNDQAVQALAEATVKVDTLAQYTIQVVNYSDALLHAVRAYYLRTSSLTETDQFIDQLSIDQTMIENIYLIDATGAIAISHTANQHPSVADRDYFKFHQTTPADELFVSSVELGRVTGKYYFRISRRINNPDGSFGGIVLVNIYPESFVRYYRELQMGGQNTVTLAGIYDHKLRARIPEPSPNQWADRFDNTQLWTALAQSPNGHYTSVSAIDGILRTYVYQKINGLALVIVTGFTDQNVANQAAAEILWLDYAEPAILIAIMTLALTLYVVLNSHAKLAAANQKLHDLAWFDPLTGLPGRTLFTDRFQVALRTAERDRTRCFLMMIDLDDFKLINDQFGHAAGDRALQWVSARMTGTVRSTDTVCRWGGDEFLILMPRAQSANKIMEIAERLIASLMEPIAIENGTCRVSASIGIANYPEHGKTLSAIHNAADTAMYLAKKQGKGRVVMANGFAAASSGTAHAHQ